MRTRRFSSGDEDAPAVRSRPTIMLLGRRVARGDVRAVRREVLEADRIEDEEECLLRDHLLAVHPKTVQPATLGWLLRHFVVTEQPPPAA